ncbi:MAG: hypothetical protein KA313_10050, partial [Pseudarcicella sp.]|nr:hypothetical protein [Pseudarcicella sp.]
SEITLLLISIDDDKQLLAVYFSLQAPRNKILLAKCKEWISFILCFWLMIVFIFHKIKLIVLYFQKLLMKLVY